MRRSARPRRTPRADAPLPARARAPTTHRARTPPALRESPAARYWPLETREVREESARGASSELVREREGERLLAASGAGALIVACDGDGDARTSAELAAWMTAERERASRDVAFIIGGAYGLSPAVRAAASQRLSFSRFTLPHELARLL